jgi:hypothetical protein
MRRRLALVALGSMLLAGCVQLPTRPEGAGLAWAWGNFCGKSYPDLGNGTTEERLTALLAIEPVDDIDAACRDHDRCYLEIGMHALRCDDALVRQMHSLRFEGADRRACRRLADQIGRFFACAMPSTGDGLDAVIGALKPLTGLHPMCPSFTTADFLGALAEAPPPGACRAVKVSSTAEPVLPPPLSAATSGR